MTYAIQASCVLAAFATLATSAPAHAQDLGRAVYDVTFDSSWSNATHPGAFPGNAHYSPLIGAVHGDGVTFWEPGGLATNGIEQMAELGATSALRGEVNAAISSGLARSVVQGSGLNSPASTTLSITLDADHPLLTLVTMVAPSPDWFVGVSGISLLENGLWVDELSVSLVAWDSGTDSGTTFTAGNFNTSPAEPIQLVTDVPSLASIPLATLTLTRRHSTIIFGGGLNPTESLFVSGEPTLGSTVTITMDDPLSVMSTPSSTFIAVSMNRVATYPAGRVLPGLGLGGQTADGELFIGAPLERRFGDPYLGSPVDHTIMIPNDPAAIGMTLYVQGVFYTPSKIGLTEAAEIVVGLP